MNSIFAKAGIAAFIALGAVSVAVSAASANEFSAGVQKVRYEPNRPGVCSPIVAVQKAREVGMRRAHIANITQRRIVVEGRNYHGPDRIVFANIPGCPRIHR